MMRRFVPVAALSILCVAAAVSQSCKSKAESQPSGKPLEPEAAVTSYSAFGIDLYRIMAAAAPGENIFISPSSVALALAMTYNGSMAETRDAMAAALKLPSAEAADVNPADSALIAGMNEPIENVELSVANSLWGRNGVEFKKDFLDRNKRYYGAEVRTLDFSDPGAPKTINAWVAEKTRDKITSIIDEINPSSILYLINAIYFKGSWSTEFDEDLTEDGPFHSATGGTVTVPFMNRSGSFEYLEGNGFQAVRLPYGDGRIGMYVFLPDTASGLEGFRASLTAESWRSRLPLFAKREGRLALPRFKMEYQRKLKGPLSELGMGVAFDPAAANFKNMLSVAGANVYIYDVIHKTFVEVNEKGTEAAAVTGVEMRLTSAMEPPDRFVMVCDRPFFFAIVDSRTGLILFMGELANPS